MTVRIITDSNGRKHITNEPLLHQPAPVQEPVAWMYEDMMGLVGVRVQKEKPIVARPVTPLYTSPPAQRQRVVFPTMLRKMWSGGEVQAWLGENVNKEKNND